MYQAIQTNRSPFHGKRNGKKTLATKLSEEYNMTNDWITMTSEGRQQSRVRKYAEYYTEDNDVYVEYISTYSNLMLLREDFLLHCIFPLSIH